MIENNRYPLFWSALQCVCRLVTETTYVPQRRHGDDCVPERLRDAGELRTGYVLLGVEHDGGEDDDGHAEREEQEAELAGARHERVAEDAQTLRVARELEDAEDAKHAERDERAAEVLVVADAEPDVVRQDGDDVDDGHDRADVATARRRRVQPQQVFDGEDDDAGGVQTEQFDAVPLAARLEPARAGHGRAARHRLHDVGGDGQRDEEPRHVVEHQRRRARLRVLERLPQLLARRRFRFDLLASLAVGRQRSLVRSLPPDDQARQFETARDYFST